MRQFFLILCFLLFTNYIFGQDRASIISEVDSISELGITGLKEYVIDRVECHRNSLLSSNLKFKNYLDNIIINDKPVNIDYLESNSVNSFRETIMNMKIKEFIWKRTFISDSLGWISTINIKYIENELSLFERVPFEEFQIIIYSTRHKVEERKQNGELIKKYLNLMNYLDIHRTDYSFEESEMKQDEMIVWTIYGIKTITLGLHLK